MLYFRFMKGPILIEDLVGPSFLGDLQTILHAIVIAETKVFDETEFHAIWLVTKASLLLCFARLCF